MSTQMITNPPVLDTTGQAIVAALNNLTEATSPTNVYIDIPLSIPVSGWDDNTPHVYTWMNENIVGNCGIEVGFADGAEDVATTFIRVTKIVGGIKFSIDEVPSASIPLIIRIINAKADSVIGDIDATMVETSAISGVTNVEEALTDLDGRVDDNADDIASNSEAISNLPITYLGSVSSLPTLNPTKNGNIGFTFANDITLDNVTIPAGTRFVGIIQSNIAHVEGISPSGDMYLLRYVPTGDMWSLLSQLATKSDIETTAWATLISGIQYRKYNGFVQVNFNIATSLTTTLTTFATLPSGFAPEKAYYFRLLGSNAGSAATVLVNTNGTIMGRVDSGTGIAVNGLIMFK